MEPAAPRVSFVFPAFNEQENIVQVLDAAAVAGRRLCDAFELVVVDDGSTDRTAALVRERAEADDQIRLIHHPSNLGYGAAVWTGLSAAKLDLVFFTDADNQFDLNELERLLPLIDRADVVAGYRLDRQDPAGRKLLAMGWNRLVRAAVPVPVRDINCAFKLMRREVLDGLHLEARGAMVNTELMAKLANAQCSIIEVGVHHYPRTAGHPTGGSPRVMLTAVRELVRLRRQLKPAHPSR